MSINLWILNIVIQFWNCIVLIHSDTKLARSDCVALMSLAIYSMCDYITAKPMTYGKKCRPLNVNRTSTNMLLKQKCPLVQTTTLSLYSHLGLSDPSLIPFSSHHHLCLCICGSFGSRCNLTANSLCSKEWKMRWKKEICSLSCSICTCYDEICTLFQC